MEKIIRDVLWHNDTKANEVISIAEGNFRIYAEQAQEAAEDELYEITQHLIARSD
jgi:hypothetical protein